MRAGQDVEEQLRWGDVLDQKEVEKGRVRIEMVSRKQAVGARAGRRRDAERPVRVFTFAPSGAYVAPHGYQTDVNIVV